MLASARSLPDSSAAIVASRPAAPTTAFSTTSAPAARTSSTRPCAALEELAGNVLTDGRGGVGVGQRQQFDAVFTGGIQQRPGAGVGGKRHQTQVGAVADDLERLRTDRAGRAEDGD